MRDASVAYLFMLSRVLRVTHRMGRQQTLGTRSQPSTTSVHYYCRQVFRNAEGNQVCAASAGQSCRALDREGQDEIEREGCRTYGRDGHRHTGGADW